MKETDYNVEEYWSSVGKSIKERNEGNIIAGDDEPYYRYKREMFLNSFTKINFKDRSVLEIGSGPGGNLREVFKKNPKRLVGCDISQTMIDIAKFDPKVELVKTNGTKLPFEDGEFQDIYTVTVLQHNTDTAMWEAILKEIGRVSGNRIILFERTETKTAGDELCIGRPVKHYEDILSEYGFALKSSNYLNIKISYFVCGVIRKIFESKSHREGKPMKKITINLQNLTLKLTKRLDKVFPAKRDLTEMIFEKK